MASTAPRAPPPTTSYEGLALRARALSAAAPGDTQVCIGVGGGPGAGKTTAATAVVELINAAEGPSTAVMIPMDGFHYTRAELRAMAAGGAGRHPKNGTAKDLTRPLQGNVCSQPPMRCGNCCCALLYYSENALRLN